MTIWCPKCGSDVSADDWLPLDHDAEDVCGYPVGGAVHGICLVEPYRETWWLRLMRWLVR